MEYLENKKSGIVIPVSNTVLLPGVETVIELDDPSDSLLYALERTQTTAIALPLKQVFNPKELTATDFCTLGVSFDRMSLKKTDKGVFLQVQIAERIAVRDLHLDGDVIYAEYESNPDRVDLDARSQLEMLEYLRKIVRELSEHFRGGQQYVKILDEISEINTLISYLSQFMPLSNEEKYEYLKMDSLRERSLHFMDALLKQKEAIELNMEINEKISNQANKAYREQVLREQLKAIQDELKEGSSRESLQKKRNYRSQIEQAEMPDEIKSAALAELEKLESQGQGSAEEGVIRNYLEFILQLPWKKAEIQPVNLEKARTILNEQHYGLEKVKERIIQHLAVMQLRKENKGSILLLVGPPGTGKTSLGKSIAAALGRTYIRLSLGGIRDEAEIRGHRRTYVGAMPGRILQSIKATKTTNPVMVLDEVDKLMTGGFSGDPASALLEVLDPEQNNTFTDHYLDLPYDLSDVFFVATANSLETIPGPLLDRMEVIQISGYTEEEKFHIGKDHLIPSVLQDHGLTAKQLIIEDNTLRRIISDYTLEAGVRGLRKQFVNIARVVSEMIVSNKIVPPYIVTPDDLEEMLGRQISRHDRAQQDTPPGVVTGLAWTPVGGEILFIEATDMPGTGAITLTGQLGDVMKESARISLSLLKSRLPLNTVNFQERDIHIHVPSGAVSKDGPSAGIALFTALASMFTGMKVDPQLAMTGEITLRGAILPIGGLKEKLLGAQRAGIKHVLIPKDNLLDLKDLPEEIKQQLTITPVETIEDVLREALDISLPRIEHVFLQKSVDRHALGA